MFDQILGYCSLANLACNTSCNRSILIHTHTHTHLIQRFQFSYHAARNKSPNSGFKLNLRILIVSFTNGNSFGLNEYCNS